MNDPQADETRAHEELAAVREVLRIIQRSPGDLDASLQAVADAAAHLCDADFSRVWLRDGDFLVAGPGVGPAREHLAELGHRIGPISEHSEQTTESAHTGVTLHVEDLRRWAEEQQAAERVPKWTVERISRTGLRTYLTAPLLRGSEVAGVLVLGRTGEPRPFSERELALAETFADQAVIAIENARLFDEVQQRNRDLTESLEQQTATSEVLQIISSSPADLRTVLQAVAEQAARICDANDVLISRLEGDVYTTEVHFGDLPLFAKVGEPSSWSEHLAQGPTNVTAAITERRTVHMPDWQAPEADAFPRIRDIAARLGQRASLTVPILHEGKALGAIVIRRVEQRAFTERQIAMLETFASQAAIAIENARLFEELERRNQEQAEALEREEATAEILRVISRSPENLDASLQAVADTAARLCQAEFSRVWLRDGDKMVPGPSASPKGHDDYMADEEQGQPRTPLHGSLIDQVSRTARTIHVENGDQYRQEHPEAMVELQRPSALRRSRLFRSSLGVPLLRGSTVIGVLTLLRGPDPRAFSEREIALAETFADQAAIAIENARLFEELEQHNREQAEALDRERATSSLLRVVGQSPGNLQPVFDAIAEAVARICEADDAGITSYAGESVSDTRSIHVTNPGILSQPPDWVYPAPDRGSGIGRAVLDRRTIHVWGEPEDVEAEYPVTARLMREKGLRAAVAVPLLKNGELLGIIFARRLRPEPFTDPQIALLETFADQAVIAIENTRLFKELQEAVAQLTSSADVLELVSRSPGDPDPVFAKIAEHAALLCEADDCAVSKVADGRMRGGAHVIRTEALPTGNPDAPVGNLTYARGRAVAERRTVHYWGDPASYAEELPGSAAWAAQSGVGAAIAVPLLSGDEAIGLIFARKRDPRPFTDKQITLLETFARQGAIAVENARLFNELQQRNQEQAEALEREQATAEVLRVIAASPTELQRVLDVVLTTAARLCRATRGFLLRYDGERLWNAAIVGHERLDGLTADDRHGERPLSPASYVIDRAIAERRVVRFFGDSAEVRAEFPRSNPPVTGWDPALRRALLGIPMLRDGLPLGGLTLIRITGEPFTDAEVALIQSFADQALIAIENARLFEELQAKNRELTESLEQQTATADILRVISESPTDVQPVLQVIVERARDITGADTASIMRRFGDMVAIGARVGPSSQLAPVGELIPLDFNRIVDSAIIDCRTIHIADTLGPDGDRFPAARRLRERWGTSSILVVPLWREGEVIGALFVSRSEVRPFTDRQIQILETFARQAVIAIENARLFEALQARNQDLVESLDQQTATAEVLRVIAASPTNVETVFLPLVQALLRLCVADQAVIVHDDDAQSRLFTRYPDGSVKLRLREGQQDRTSATTFTAQAIRTRALVHVVGRIEDWEADYPDAAASNRGDGRTEVAALAVPLLRRGEPVGAVLLFRDQARRYSDREIALAETFADQAVIAIENARLFDALQARNQDLIEALERQTATADILEVISRSPTDLQAVLDAIVAQSARLVGAEGANIQRLHGDRLETAARLQDSTLLNPTPGFVSPVDVTRRDRLTAVAVLDRVTMHRFGGADAIAEEFPERAEGWRITGTGSALAVPLLMGDVTFGACSSRGARRSRSPTRRSPCWRPSRTRP